jgi:hypothetical protein
VSDNLPEVNAYDDGIDMFLLRSKPRLQPISYDTSVALPLSYYQPYQTYLIFDRLCDEKASSQTSSRITSHSVIDIIIFNTSKLCDWRAKSKMASRLATRVHVRLLRVLVKMRRHQRKIRVWIRWGGNKRDGD